MRYTACKVSQAPLYSLPDGKGVLVSQIHFGETAIVLDAVGNYRLLRCTWDASEGWCDVRHLERLSIAEFEKIQDNYVLSLALMDGLMAKDHFMPITIGATLPNYDGLQCSFGDKKFQFSASVVDPKSEERDGDFAIKIAKRFLHAPEMEGGRSLFGIDAAGLTQTIYKFLNIKLLRKTIQQVQQGRLIDFMEECQAGDLAFFDSGEGEICHVGIMLDDCSIIHAHGQVRMDKVDHFGIYNTTLKRYTHQLRVVKRFLKDVDVTALQQKEQPESNATEENQGSLFV